MLKPMILAAIMLMGPLLISMNHPLAMGLVLLIQTVLISLLTGILNSSFWMSYILFLVFLGGMLVLFIYMTSLASNEMFSISSPIITFAPVALFWVGLISWGVSLFDCLNPAHVSFKSFNQLHDNFLLSNLTLKLYNTFSSHLTFLLVIYLFLTLIIVVKLTSIDQGPLRPYH
uniref:NADH-ubiquinone oxidoreductase chain 6 n=1 Tax=Torleya grandiforceps TaxID=2748052 RepID=A0A7D6JVP4_9INSE|nr:NADH dehydrogenase subunit 6 [Torleya grandiforceps]QLP89018.1 NADH dehydrogenase subunit 6 [Torleya grandiforceps]